MTDATEYSPKPGSLPWRFITWLRANPDEELTRNDIAVKFDCQASSVDTLLSLPTAGGVLIRKRNSQMELVWGLGESQSVEPTQANGGDDSPIGRPARCFQGRTTEAVESGAQMPTQRSSPFPTVAPVKLVLSEIAVRKGIRLLTPEEKRRAEFMEWFDKFDIGDSAEFDETHLATIRAESKRHAKATKRAYKIAATGPGRAGVERTA